MFKEYLNYYSRLVNGILGLSGPSKKLLSLVTDYFILTFCFWASLSVRINTLYIPTRETNLLILLGPALALPIFYLFGLYQSKILHQNYTTQLTIMSAVTTYTVFWFFIVLSAGVVYKPYDFLIINWLLSSFSVGGVRYVTRWLLRIKAPIFSNVVIYGAGSSGAQINSALMNNPEVKVVAFLDDDPKLHGLNIGGIKIQKPSSLTSLIEKKGVSEVLLAIPSITRLERHNLLQSLKKYPVGIRALPGLADLVQGRVSTSDLKKVNIEDLLRRGTRKPDEKLLKQDIEQKNVMVTGAGGSIGSELCREILRKNPKLLILFDISEFALYSIERELLEINPEIRVITVLGDVTEGLRLVNIIENFEVQTIYHAAAYKHVPMVEKNMVAGVKTNIFGTLACIEAAIAGCVESFVFISTDKAVRPTNLMGATKRFAELILQALSEEQARDNKEQKTRISMVRFGNVLGSSGSVVPLFREQIQQGGPITVTHPEIVRYFMTITEASQLVIQAGAMGSQGDIFLLDMGEQISVVDLAKDMIRLSDMTLKDEQNPDGDIEIIFTGLRPGEKLYEELLIDEDAKPTRHVKIMRAREKGITWIDLQEHITELEGAIRAERENKIREIFLNTVAGYSPEDEIVDYMYLQQKNRLKENL